MRESDLLQHIYHRSAGLSDPSILVGPGDDCAVVRTNSGDPLLLTVDQLIEGRHYEPGTSIELIARKAIARSVSDIAAMGGTPTWALATAALPAGYPDADELFDAMHRWAVHFACPLVGGDIAAHASPDHPLTLTVTVGGTPHAARGPVLRSCAQPGDAVFVTGRLGGSLPSGHHLSFTPRVAEAQALAGTLGDGLGAMIDLSDGLGRDAGRVAAASGVRIELDADTLPRAAGISTWQQAAGDGEDYELCFTARPDAIDRVPADIDGTPITPIGRVVAGAGCVIRTAKETIDAESLGWDH